MATNTPVTAESLLTVEEKNWIKAASYRDLVEHLLVASFRNKFHNGDFGRYFSDAMNAKRAAYTPERALEIEAEVIRGAHPKIDATRH